MRQKNNYNLLLEKLDQFIRKYYINKLIQGFLYTTGIIVLAYTAFVLLESYMYFSSSVRKGILASFTVISAGSLLYWVGAPVLSYFKLGNRISQKQAASIIGNHFPDVKDKLLNVLQLQDQAGQNVQQAELIKASVEQKSNELSPVQFKNAIDYRNNRKYLKYALPPVLLLLTLLVAAPSLISDGTKRLIHANEHFERLAPFTFNILNEDLETPQFEDYTLQMSVDGSVLPSEVYIDINGFRYLLSQNREGTYSYTFKNVREIIDFKFTAAGFDSKLYSLRIKERALLNNFQVNVKYPAYTGIKSEILNNVGDLIVPKGTTIEWMMNTINTDFIYFGFKTEKEEAERKGKSYFLFSKKAMVSTPYHIYIGNKLIERPDTTSYQIQVIEDKYPSIDVKDFPDSTEVFQKYFAGEVADDYGLNNLFFKYLIKDEKGNTKKEDKINVTIDKGRRSSDFTFQIDLRTLSLEAGDNIEYYFEIFDNDGINGSKSSRSVLMNTKKESIRELKDQRKQNKEEIENKLSQSSGESKDIQQKIQALKESLLQKKEMDWQSRKELENLMKMQEDLLEKMKETKDKFRENQENRKETRDEEDSMKEKEEKLEELFKEIEDNEANDLMKKIQEMMQKLDREQTISTLDEMKKNNEIMQKNMERLEELYKNLEVEYEMQEMAKDLQEMAEKQEELAKDTQKGEKSSEELLQEQEKLNKEMDALQKKMEDVKEKNENLQRPKDTEGGEDSMDDAKDEMDKAGDELKKDNKKEAQKKQKKAAEKMKEAAEKMKEGMQGANMDAMEEDLESLRQLLENLLNVSFSQEDLIKGFASTAINTPKYVSLVQEQFRIKDNFKLVEDSLFALSKRVIQLEAVVLEKSAEIKYNLEKSLGFLEERQVSAANNTQQRAMTYANDLALLFNEAMENLQQQMSNSMPGNQMCNNPKPGAGESGKMPLDKISEGQEKLTEEMKKMSDQIKDGQKGNQNISAKEMAEMMQRQAQLRQALEKLSEEKRSKGQGSKLLQEIIDQMDKTEMDLANKRLTNETLRRQEQITLKLLEADKAEREQEFEEKRRAEVAKQQAPPRMPKELEDYLKQKSNSINEYRTVSPELNSYYRNLVENYMNSLKLN